MVGDKFICICDISYTVTLSVTKHRRRGGIYYDLWDQKRIRGKVVRKYVGYLGTSPKAKQEITPEVVYPYVRRLLTIGIDDTSVSDILKRIGIETEIWPITKLIIEHDRKLNRLFLRFK